MNCLNWIKCRNGCVKEVNKWCQTKKTHTHSKWIIERKLLIRKESLPFTKSLSWWHVSLCFFMLFFLFMLFVNMVYAFTTIFSFVFILSTTAKYTQYKYIYIYLYDYLVHNNLSINFAYLIHVCRWHCRY